MLSLLTGVGGRGVALATQLVAVPLLIGYLGRERYGVHETLTALAVWLGLTNGGLNLGLLNALIDRQVTEDVEGARREVASALFPTFALVTFTGALVALVSPLLPWTRLFAGVTEETLRQIPLAATIATIAALLGILSGLVGTVYAAHQETHKLNLWDTAARLVSIAACVFIVRATSWSLIGAAVAMALTPALVRVVNGFVLFWSERPELRPHLRDFEATRLVRNLRQSVVFFGLQMTSFALFQLDRPIVAALHGPVPAAEYAISARLFALAYGLFSIVYAPLWAGHGDAWRRGDFAWVRRSVRLTFVLGLAAAFALGAMQLLAGEKILALWTRTSVRAPYSLTIAFTLTFVVRVWTDSRSVVLNSAGILVPQLWFWAAQVAVALPLCFILGRHLGPTGVAWALPIAAIPTTLWGYPWLLRRRMAARERSAIGSPGSAPESPTSNIANRRATEQQ